MCGVLHLFKISKTGPSNSNTSTAPTRAQKKVSSNMTPDGKNCCRNASPNITWGPYGRTNYMFQNFITWAHCEEHNTSVMHGHAVPPLVLTHTL